MVSGISPVSKLKLALGLHRDAIAVNEILSEHWPKP
jgi:hypothetical protein